jgi:hypothetical protein
MMTFQYTTLNNMLVLLAAGILMVSCSDSATNPEPPLETTMAEDVPANVDGERGSPPDFTFYNLENNSIISDEDSASTKWDLAFSGTTILTNNGSSGPGQGGAVILDVPFGQVDMAPSSGFNVDTDTLLAIPTGSGNGWYNYTGGNEPQNAILPLPDKTIVIKTASGNYAKINILSYYEGNPDTSTDEFANSETRPPGRYYTFEYILQTDGSRTLE